MKKENTSTRLKQIMQERNLRQVDVLERTIPLCRKYDVKMNKSDISQYVSGKVEPNQDKLFVLSLALNVSEGWLMGFDVSKARASAPADPLQLTEQEKWLIDTYRELDDPQRERLLAYIEGLLDAGSLKNHLYKSPVVNEFMNCYDSPSGLMVAEPMSEYTSESQYEPVTIAAHHDSDEWSEDELKEIEDIKKYAKSKKK